MNEQILDNASANVLGDKSSTSADQNANLTNRDHNGKQNANTNTENACKQNANLKTNASTKTTNTESDTSAVKKLGFLAVLFMLIAEFITHITTNIDKFSFTIVIALCIIVYIFLYKISQIIDKNVKDLNLTKTAKRLIICEIVLILLSVSLVVFYALSDVLESDIYENEQILLKIILIFFATNFIVSLPYLWFYFFWCKKICKAGKTPLFWAAFVTHMFETLILYVDMNLSFYSGVLHTLTLALAFFMFKEMKQEEKI